MAEQPTSPRHRWRRPLLGVVAGALAAALAFLTLGLVRSDPVEDIVAGYRLSDEDALAPGPVSLVSVWDVRQPTSVPGLAAPTGDRYITLIVALDSPDDTEDDWYDLDELTLTLDAVDGAGEREELTPTDRGSRMLEDISGQVRGVDPYWIRLSYEPAALEAEHYEATIAVGGEEYTLTARDGEAA